MARIRCPECEALLNLPTDPTPGKAIRCPRCHRAFRPEVEESDDMTTRRRRQEEEEEEPRPAVKRRREEENDDQPARRRSRQKRQKSHLLLFSLLGGGLVLGAAALVLVILLTRGGSGGGDGGLPGGNLAVTKANWEKINFGMTRKEVEDLLGGAGTPADLEAVSMLLKPRTQGGFNENLPAPLRGAGGKDFFIWRQGGNHIIVGFVPSQKYGELSTYAGWFADLGGGATEYGQQVTNAFNLEQARDRREKEQKALSDPKWKKGPAIRRLLVGKWLDKLSGYAFNADGTMTKLLKWGPDYRQGPGTYTFIDDDHIEVNHVDETALGDKKSMVKNIFKVLVNETELSLPLKLGDGYVGGGNYRREGTKK